jgi:hypothetical protein
MNADGFNNTVPGFTGEVYVVYGIPHVPADFDLLRGSAPEAMTLHASNASAPFDEAPGTLGDGSPYFYQLDGPFAQATALAVNKQRRSNTVRISWKDPDRCTTIPVSSDQTAIGASHVCLTADGASIATVAVVPRDDFGDLLGTGLSVAVDAVEIGPGVLVGEVEDHFVGLYTQDVLAPQAGVGHVVVSVEGTRIDPGLEMRFVASVPVADFSWATPVRAGEPVTFLDLSAGGVLPYTYAWDFESDGAVDSTAPSPGHVYPSPGPYAVTLVIEDAQGCPAELTLLMEVLP